MKISKAMKKLKKLKNKASTIAAKIDRNNRTLIDNEAQYDMTELLKEYQETISSITHTKDAIMKANIESGNYERILRIGELKGFKSVLENVNTDYGVEDASMSYHSSSEKSEYKVQIDAKELETIVTGIEDEIEENMDVLDEFNAKTDI